MRLIPHIPCIRVCAPMEFRIRRMMEHLRLDDPDQIRQSIEINDAAHDCVARDLFAISWMDPTHYNRVLCTERLTIEDCVDQIERLLERDTFIDDDDTALAPERFPIRLNRFRASDSCRFQHRSSSNRLL
jgi:hypothetical protein